MNDIKLEIKEDVDMEQPFSHTISDDEPDDTCDVFSYAEFKNWIEDLMKNGR